jgi:hypothetical protein
MLEIQQETVSATAPPKTWQSHRHIVDMAIHHLFAQNLTFMEIVTSQKPDSQQISAYKI